MLEESNYSFQVGQMVFSVAREPKAVNRGVVKQVTIDTYRTGDGTSVTDVYYILEIEVGVCATCDNEIEVPESLVFSTMADAIAFKDGNL